MNSYSKLRQYDENTREYFLYKNMHENQSLAYATYKRESYKKLNKTKMSIKKVLSLMDNFIDPSDPDLNVPNSIHAYQTAERIRALEPANKELQVIGLIHDLGKILFWFGEPSWAVVGDTYVLGCEFPPSIVYYETLKSSPDANKYSNLGIYEENCGMNTLTLSFGHDEYLYCVLKGNQGKHRISEKYIDVIRFHSLYPWHTGGAYKQFMNKDGSDHNLLKDVLNFNKYDLYSKEDSESITDDTKEYYNKLLDEFFFDDLNW